MGYSCSPPCSGSSSSNTTSRTSVGNGYTIKYGGGGGPNDYSVISTRFHNNLLPDVDNWANNFAWYVDNYTTTQLSWIGHIGTFGTGRCTWHRYYKAWDINHIRFANGSYLHIVDRYQAFESSSRTTRRLYWAVDASLRRYFSVVIDGADANHHNHFHVDESCGSVGVPYLPWLSYSIDTKFIQWLCNDFNNANIDDDGYWGNQTEAAWNSLIAALDMSCVNPRTSASSWKTFLSYIIRHGLKNKSAGYYNYICSEIQ